jgi:hypothetical protein
MLKSFPLTSVLSAVLILSIGETVFSSSITAALTYPVVPNSEIDTLVCYMQTADGRILNLDTLCGKELQQILLSCPTITDAQVRDRIIQYCGNDEKCLTSAGCKQVARD